MSRTTLLEELVEKCISAERRGEPLAPEEVCRSCPEMVAELRSRLEEYRAGLQTQSSDPSSGVYPLPTLPGYEIQRELGRGGMGVVYRARHLELKRDVALKMVLAGSSASPQQKLRFQLEAEMLASLQHPNIVQVFEVGEQEECMFIALEYLDGVALEDLLTGDPQHPIDSALLIETLARAIHVAHARGIVHRDLKPANVMLVRGSQDTRIQANLQPLNSDEEITLTTGIAKILDFGLAKKLEDNATQTRSGALLGTPVYMSPEQAVGNPYAIGPPTDVYALGVILYELLVGHPPLEGDSVISTLSMIRERDPISPTRLCPTVPRDLATICMKCLAKEPGQRYETAEALADDIRRFLVGKPILARRNPWYVRARLWVRRHPAATAVLSVCSLAIIAVVAILVWSNREFRAKNAELEVANQRARNNIDKLFDVVIEEWIAPESEADTKVDPNQKRFLKTSLELYEGMARDQAGHPELLESTARAHHKLGDVHRRLGNPKLAERSYRQAIGLRTQLAARDGANAQHRFDLADSLNWLGEVHRVAERDETALGQYRKAAELLETLVEEHPEEPKYVRDLARAIDNQGIVSKNLDKAEQAKQLYEKSIRFLSPLASSYPNNPGFQQELARTWINLGNLLGSDKKKTKARRDAERCLGQALDTFRSLSDKYKGTPIYRFEGAVAKLNLATLLQQTAVDSAQSQEAIVWCDRARGDLEKLRNQYPDRIDYQIELANVFNTLAAVRVRDKSEESQELAKQAWIEAGRRSGRIRTRWPRNALAHYRGGLAFYNLGLLEAKKKNETLALDYFEKALPALTTALELNRDRSKYQRQAFLVFRRVIRGGLERGETERSVDLANRFLDLYDKKKSPLYRFEGAKFLGQCAKALEAADKRQLAEQCLDRALEVLDEIDVSSFTPTKPVEQEEHFSLLRENERFRALVEKWTSPSTTTPRSN